jgi:hypothetical protein
MCLGREFFLLMMGRHVDKNSLQTWFSFGAWGHTKYFCFLNIINCRLPAVSTRKRKQKTSDRCQHTYMPHRKKVKVCCVTMKTKPKTTSTKKPKSHFRHLLFPTPSFLHIYIIAHHAKHILLTTYPIAAPKKPAQTSFDQKKNEENDDDVQGRLRIYFVMHLLFEPGRCGGSAGQCGRAGRRKSIWENQGLGSGQCGYSVGNQESRRKRCH